MANVDNRRYACIQLIPACLVEQVLYGGFIHLRPKILQPRYWVSYLDATVPEHSYERLIAPSLSALDRNDTVAVLVQDWRWEERSHVTAILAHGQTVLTPEWRLLSRMIPDKEIPMLELVGADSGCCGCGNKLNYKETTDLLLSTVRCAVCGTHNRLHVDDKWLHRC